MNEGKLQFMYVKRPTDPAEAASRVNWTPQGHAMFAEYWANLERLKDEGVPVLAGYPQDADGGGPAICIIEVGSEAEAQRIFAAEPFIKRGFATGTLDPYHIAISRSEL
jgi:uncharacterized protein YciI